MKINQFFYIFLITINIISFTNVLGQTGKISGGFGAINFGLSMVNVKNLNSNFQNYGYPKFSQNYFTNNFQFGGSIYGVKNNIVYGIDASGFASKGVHNNTYNGSISGEIVSLDFGYLILRKEKFLVYPLLGIGSERLNVKIIQTNNSNQFNVVAGSPGKGFDIFQSNPLIHFTIAGTYIIERKKSDGSSVHWIIGLKGGYRYNPANNNWKVSVNKTKILDGPNIGISGPYLQLIIGQGKFKRS